MKTIKIRRRNNMSATAKMREKAMLYEMQLNWHYAALCWAEAIKMLPDALGLNARAKQLMSNRLRDCERAALSVVSGH